MASVTVALAVGLMVVGFYFIVIRSLSLPTVKADTWLNPVAVVLLYPAFEEAIFRSLLLTVLIHPVSGLPVTVATVIRGWLVMTVFFIIWHIAAALKKGPLRLVDAFVIAVVCGWTYIFLVLLPETRHLGALAGLFVVFAFHSVYNLVRLLLPVPILSPVIAFAVGLAAMIGAYHLS